MTLARFLPCLASLAIAGVVVAGCGSSDNTTGGDASADAAPQDGSTGGDASHDGAPSDASGDAIPPADGPFACGTATCNPNQFCEQPCCGGVAPPCVPPADGGQCPTGSHADSSCQMQGGSTGCREDPCTPPPAFCTDKVTDPGCTIGANRQVTCLCA